MGNETAIEWTAGKDGKPGATWNPWWGCSEIAPECGTHGGGSGLCYAAAFASRGLHPAHRGNAANGQWTGTITISGEPVWKAPFKLAAGTKVFTCSMSDFWHEDVPLPTLDRALGVIDDTPSLTYLILTKRPGNVNRKLAALKRRWPKNAWAGTSIGHVKSLPLLKPLRQIDAPLRFLSSEPLLTSLVPGLTLDGIGWLIAGGQSGPHARPSHPDWFRSLRDQCQAAGVPFFFKQWGEWWCHECNPFPMNSFAAALKRAGIAKASRIVPPRGMWMPNGTFLPNAIAGGPPAYTMYRIGKKAAGAMLDGREWREVPTPPEPPHG